MIRWLTRSTAPIALLIALGLVALAGTLVLPTSTTEVRTDSSVVGAPAATTVTHDTQSTGIAVALLVVAVVAFTAAILLGVARRRIR
jgi:phosphate/sulfate permease